MPADNKIISGHTGTLQEERVIPELDAGSLLLSGRDMNDYIVFAAAFSKYINYYNEHNVIDGTWEPFFNNETLFIPSYIANIDIKQKLAYYENIISLLQNPSSLTEGENGHGFAKVNNAIQEIIGEIGDWYLIYKNPATGNAFYTELEKEYNSLRENGLYEQVTTSNAEAANNIELINYLRDAYNTQSYLINAARKHLAATLSSNENYEPHIALYIVFVKLLRHAQQSMNTIPAKHLDFYYRDVLKMNYLGNVPDTVHVYFQLNQGVNNYLLPANTLLSAGKDKSGNEILFATRSDLNINTAQIVSLKTIYLAFNPDIANSFGGQLATALYAAPVANSANGLGPALPATKLDDGWPILGADQTYNDLASRSMGDADLGFAISAPILLLQEGERYLEISLSFSLESLSSLNEKTNIIRKGKPDLPIEDVFSDAFILSMSGPKGWIGIKNYVVKYIEPGQITISILLTPDEQPVVRYNKVLCQDSFETNWPVLKVILNKDARIFAYSLLKNIVLNNVNISASAKGLSNLLLYNSNGQLDPTAPFQPFGPIPIKDSYLAIGAEEMARKNITGISLEIEWFGLPPNGLYDYYRAYTGTVIDNYSFKVVIEGLSKGTWIVSSTESKTTLFESEDDDAPKENSPINKKRYIQNIAFGQNGLPINSRPDVPFKLSNATPSGFIRLRLEEPLFGFGQPIYTSVMSTTTITNMANVQKNASSPPPNPLLPILPLPNPPYVPVMQSVKLSYTSQAELDLSNPSLGEDLYEISVFQIKPFCIYRVKTGTNLFNILDASEQEAPMTTAGGGNGDKQGYLYIGFQNVEVPQRVDTLFQLIGHRGVNTETKPEHYEWKYLSNNEWKDFEKDQRPIDNTGGFMSPAIITFKLPADMTADNIIMPAGIYWIRVGADRVSPTLGRVVSIQPQTTTAERVITDNSIPVEKKRLEPGSITKLKNPISQIKNVYQPFYTYPSRSAENQTNLYTRVSERLKHKQRAITVEDYEKITLQQFPFLTYVLCIPHTAIGENSIPENRPGSVLLIVIRSTEYEPDKLKYAPKLTYNTLKNIQKYIRQYSPPFTDVAVANPIYDFLTINIIVKFADDKTNEFYTNKLNTDIRDHLSFWIKGNQNCYDRSNSLDASAIKSFIAQLPYVKAITLFFITKTNGDDTSNYLERYGEDRKFEPLIDRGTPWRIAASVEKHNILTEGDTESMQDTGVIGSAEINADLIIYPGEGNEN